MANVCTNRITFHADQSTIDWLDYYFSKKETKQNKPDESYDLPF